jgi:uncharacterized protein DUF1579
MFSRIFAPLVLLLVATGVAAEAPGADRTKAASAIERMSEPGPEAEMLQQRAGTWDVDFTLWPSPGATPIVTRGLVAERTMIGLFLQEVMRPAPDSTVPAFRRLDYLSYDRVEGRWKYVSMDTRFPAGIMPAWSLGGEVQGVITLQFEPLGFVGFGEQIEGRFVRSDMVITRAAADHEFKRQHFTMADGTGKTWLAVQYEYRRRSP